MTRADNIRGIVDSGLCTGCGACAGLCPHQAIELQRSPRKGLYEPRVAPGLCQHCGLCLRICPGQELDLPALELALFQQLPAQPALGNVQGCFVGFAADQSLRSHCSSGGLVTQLLIAALQKNLIQGALVTRLSRKNPLEPEPFIARTPAEILEAAQSKYCPAPAALALKLLLDAPQGETFAVVGLPCHLAAIRKAEAALPPLKKRIVLHLGLVCHHTPTFHATAYLLATLRLQPTQVAQLAYRGQGWPGSFQVRTQSGQELRVPSGAPHYWGWVFRHFFIPARCQSCEDKGCHLADLVFADAWLPEYTQRASPGISLVLIRHDPLQLVAQLAQEKVLLLTPISPDALERSQQLQGNRRMAAARRRWLQRLGRRLPCFGRPPAVFGWRHSLQALVELALNGCSGSWKLVRLLCGAQQGLRRLKRLISKGL